MLNPDTNPRIGIDLGGTKTEIIALSPEGEILFRKRVQTPSKDYRAIIGTIHVLVKEATNIVGPCNHIGIGIPGAINQHTGLVKNANTTCLIGKPLQKDLEQVLKCEVRLENDANCFTLSEATDGAGAGKNVVFGVILGTGVGAGWCMGGKLHQGMHHIAGEWGHNPVPLRINGHINDNSVLSARTEKNIASCDPFLGLGRQCYCGKHDCIETHLCGAGLVKTHALLSGDAADVPDGMLTARQIADLATRGDEISLKALNLYARQVACCLATVINMIDPDIIVLGGGLSNLDPIYPLISRSLPDFVFNDRALTPVVKATHGDSSGVRGAAWL